MSFVYFLSFSGYFLGFYTVYTTTASLLLSPMENRTSSSCLKFYTFGNRDLRVIVTSGANMSSTFVPMINTTTKWRPIQVKKTHINLYDSGALQVNGAKVEVLRVIIYFF